LGLLLGGGLLRGRGGGSLLGGLGGTLLLLGHLDGLVALRLAHLRLHVTLGQDLGQRGTDDGALELLGAAGALLGGLLLDTLAVLATVEHGPRNLAGIALHQVGALALLVQEGEGLKGYP